ncbi:hypothetical protein [Cellulophaga fucicola]|uniref:Uncharacterized protein n=1 Tax=Cellulophaga fucicola TaxID=76595 RepID=A0A1K1PN05_9FLAO|nr:hypothetical protein [Cellulophaga fucicola]SFW49130.1 hypothetical protein SAMN05660313_02046 [Cellulophaga fucicola]
MAKIAFKSDKFYKYKNAFSVSKNTLQRVWINANPNKLPIDVHSKITGRQTSLYKNFAKSRDRLYLDKMAEIEIKAMTEVGIPKAIAQG